MTKNEIIAAILGKVIPSEQLAEILQAEELSEEQLVTLQEAQKKLVSIDIAPKLPAIRKMIQAQVLNGVDADLGQFFQNPEFADLLTPEAIEAFENKDLRTQDKIKQVFSAVAKKPKPSPNNEKWEAALKTAKQQQEALKAEYENRIASMKRDYTRAEIDRFIAERTSGLAFENDTIRELVVDGFKTKIHNNFHTTLDGGNIVLRDKDNPELPAFSSENTPIEFDGLFESNFSAFKKKNGGGENRSTVVLGAQRKPNAKENENHKKLHPNFLKSLQKMQQ